MKVQELIHMNLPRIQIDFQSMINPTNLMKAVDQIFLFWSPTGSV